MRAGKRSDAGPHSNGGRRPDRGRARTRATPWRRAGRTSGAPHAGRHTTRATRVHVRAPVGRRTTRAAPHEQTATPTRNALHTRRWAPPGQRACKSAHGLTTATAQGSAHERSRERTAGTRVGVPCAGRHHPSGNRQGRARGIGGPAKSATLPTNVRRPRRWQRASGGPGAEGRARPRWPAQGGRRAGSGQRTGSGPCPDAEVPDRRRRCASAPGCTPPQGARQPAAQVARQRRPRPAKVHATEGAHTNAGHTPQHRWTPPQALPRRDGARQSRCCTPPQGYTPPPSLARRKGARQSRCCTPPQGCTPPPSPARHKGARHRGAERSHRGPRRYRGPNARRPSGVPPPPNGGGRSAAVGVLRHDEGHGLDDEEVAPWAVTRRNTSAA